MPHPERKARLYGSHQFSIAPQLGIRPHELLSPPSWNTDWFNLIQAKEAAMCSLMHQSYQVQNHCLTPVLHGLWLSYAFQILSETCEKGV